MQAIADIIPGAPIANRSARSTAIATAVAGLRKLQADDRSKPPASLDGRWSGQNFSPVSFSIQMEPELVERWDTLLQMPPACASWIDALGMPRPLGPATKRAILRKYPIFSKFHCLCWCNANVWFDSIAVIEASEPVRKRTEERLGKREYSAQQKQIMLVRCMLEEEISFSAYSKETGKAVAINYVSQLMTEVYSDDDLWYMMNNETPEEIIEAVEIYQNSKQEMRARANARLQGAPM